MDPAIDYAQLLELGIRCQDGDQLDQLMPFVLAWLQREPSRREAFIAMADFYNDDRKPQFAAQILDLGIQLNPIDMDFRESYGQYLEINGDNLGAIAEYFIVAEEEPSSGRGFFKIGEVYLRMGEVDSARMYFHEASLRSVEYGRLANDLLTEHGYNDKL